MQHVNVDAWHVSEVKHDEVKAGCEFSTTSALISNHLFNGLTF